jgi:hypothetical protein
MGVDQFPAGQVRPRFLLHCSPKQSPIFTVVGPNGGLNYKEGPWVGIWIDLDLFWMRWEWINSQLDK